ncbi:DUF2845 domain-containing protein [Pseudomonas sp. NY15181]|uniref:DUF2845 domain-containing protein n=1 Tax=Pseudomonas sp. NY15181 TaxID=3400349 RepID=UPI003A848715
MTLRISLRPVLLVLLLLAVQSEAASLRCNSKLISTGNLTSEVLDRCGPPVDRSFLGYKEVVGDWGQRNEVAVEEWIYGPWNGMVYFVRFEGNRLTTIQSKRSGN